MTTDCYEIMGFGFDHLKPARREIGKVEDHEVLVNLQAWSLNYRDLMMIKGHYNPKLKMPIIPLSDGCGVVVETGSKVTDFKVGDKVCPNFMLDYQSGSLNKKWVAQALGGAIDGVLAKTLKFSENGLVKIPDHLTFSEGATLPCAALTAWSSLFHYARIKPGDTILTYGSGGVSLFAISFAKMAGAKIIVVSAKEEKYQELKAHGATECLNYKTNSKWDDHVLELTNGNGVDQVIELGGANTLEKSVRVCKLNGTISLIGVLAGIGNFNPISILMKAIKLQGIFVGNKSMFEEMNEAITLHKIKPAIDSKKFKYETVIDAYKYFDQGIHFGKVVINL